MSKNKELVAKWFDSVWGANYNPEVIRELAADDIFFHYPMHGEFRGPEAVIAMLSDFRESFEDLNFWATGELIEEGNKVVATWDGGGTHTGKAFTESPFGGPLPANSGKVIRFTGTTIIEIENGKVKSEVGQEGAIDALLQMGLVQKTS
ncbi:hypothetical protein AN237_25270 (plasmid) [Raoultella ornithinolytica]|uniref:ester cyclase n=1 Tax=Raoultella ornithinolytica TaxID=54291 RepID=UPI00084A2414|nr:ester cyclase [Raoultella ornithinolytica]AOO59867.1 hypothetical protein AN237_25270 [Raoultella ornithinolytica]